MRFRALLFMWLTGLCVPVCGQPPLLPNGGFEGGQGRDGKGGGIPGWQPFEKGYDLDTQTFRHGNQSLRCDSTGENAAFGGLAILELKQTTASPVQITGWSKADAVSGAKNPDYALYVDMDYTDGTHLWGQSAPFSVGTHDWERRRILLLPQKPIATVRLYALFRNHSGTVWFDDFYARELKGANVFDAQPLTLPARPAMTSAFSAASGDGLKIGLGVNGDITETLLDGMKLPANGSGGFFARDAAAEGPIVPLRGKAAPRALGGIAIDGANSDLQIRFNAKLVPHPDSVEVDCELTDIQKTDRALTVYFALPVDALGWQWGQDIRRSETIKEGREYTNQVRVNVGATGGLSLYPFAAVTQGNRGIGIAFPVDWPGVFRLLYNAAARRFVIAWDVAITKQTAAWPNKTRVRCTLFRIPANQAAWGFRAAAQKFYALNSAKFARRAKNEGIWMPFTDPAKVENAADFGFAYHEGDNSLKSDDALNILSFRYTEPSTFWLPMPPEMPRTYENAVALLRKTAADPKAEHYRMARATLNSGTFDAQGKFNLEFQNQPWANGAVFVLNPNPELPATETEPTRASVAYPFSLVETMYGKGAKERGIQDGEYLDSLESWLDTLDYRAAHLQFCPYPIPYDADSYRPVVPQWYAVHTFTRYLSDDLHNRGKLLFANTTPVRFSTFAPLLDVMGIETNWLDSAGNWQPDDDATFNLRRTLSAKKPYLLLMNTNYDKFTPGLVEKYFQKCLFYGVYPGMFSADAATNPYWETPRWYNRDRLLFRKYIPLIKTLSAAGWEPLTLAISDNSAVFMERFGTRYLSLYNETKTPQETTLTLDTNWKAAGGGEFSVQNLLNGQTLPTTETNGRRRIKIRLNGEESALLQVN